VKTANQFSAGSQRIDVDLIWSKGAPKADPAKLIEAAEQILADAKRDYGIAQKIVEAAAQECQLKDMPEGVLDGRLGEICADRMGAFPRAYSWPALLACGSVLMEPNPSIRTNLYGALVGPVHSGKTQAIQQAINILGIEPPALMPLLSGSGEQLVRHASNAAGNPRLFSPDELGHLLEKVQIQRASYSYILNMAFYQDRFEVLMGHRQAATFDCALSILGGMVEDRFQDLFNAGTTGGLYDRFLFGLCPNGYSYDYFPFHGAAEVTRPVGVGIDPGVWAEKSQWKIEDGELNPRVAEIVLRAATVCAAFSGARLLTSRMLGPARELARYQTSIRKILRPNPGENYEARLAHKFLNYLARHGGKYVSRRKMFQDTRAYDLGPSTAEKALSVLQANGDVATTKVGRKVLVRLVSDLDEVAIVEPQS
jgi:hypothetical protein